MNKFGLKVSKFIKVVIKGSMFLFRMCLMYIKRKYCNNETNTPMSTNASKQTHMKKNYL